MTGRLIIIASPSGGGKTSVIKHLLSRHPQMVHSISCTTREIRPGEKNGEYYHYISRKDFKDGIAKGYFIEWQEVHGNLYGTPKMPLDKWLAEEKMVLLDLDVLGSLNLKKMYGDRAVSVFLEPPSIEELKKRLLGRASDSTTAQKLRLQNALTELTFKDKFDYRVINNVLERAVTEIETILGL